MEGHDVGGAPRPVGAWVPQAQSRGFHQPLELYEGIVHAEDREERPLRKTPILRIRST